VYRDREVVMPRLHWRMLLTTVTRLTSTRNNLLRKMQILCFHSDHTRLIGRESCFSSNLEGLDVLVALFSLRSRNRTLHVLSNWRSVKLVHLAHNSVTFILFLPLTRTRSIDPGPRQLTSESCQTVQIYLLLRTTLPLLLFFNFPYPMPHAIHLPHAPSPFSPSSLSLSSSFLPSHASEIQFNTS